MDLWVSTAQCMGVLPWLSCALGLASQESSLSTQVRFLRSHITCSGVWPILFFVSVEEPCSIKAVIVLFDCAMCSGSSPETNRSTTCRCVSSLVNFSAHSQNGKFIIHRRKSTTAKVTMLSKKHQLYCDTILWHLQPLETQAKYERIIAGLCSREVLLPGASFRVGRNLYSNCGNMEEINCRDDSSRRHSNRRDIHPITGLITIQAD